jgi:hypothetical protein
MKTNRYLQIIPYDDKAQEDIKFIPYDNQAPLGRVTNQ